MENDLKEGKKLYGFSGWFITKYFETEKELENFCETNGTQYGSKCIIEYLGDFEGRESVIKKTFLDRKESLIICPIDYHYLELYNSKTKEWFIFPGDYKDEYEAFRKIGKIKKDVYLELNLKVEKFNEWFEMTLNK